MSDISFNVECNSKPTKNGLYRIYLRVTENRIHTRLKTEVFIERKDQFNSTAKNGRYIRTSHSKYAALNAELELELQRLKDKYRQIREEVVNDVSAKVLLKRINDRDLTLFKDFVENRLEEMQRTNKDLGYCRALKSKTTIFLDFAGHDIALKAIDLDLLNNFKIHLTEKKLHPNTISEYFTRIRQFIKVALDLDLIVKDPFRNFITDKELPTERLRLTDTEVKAIEDLKLSTIDGWLYIAQQTFLFSFYNAGIRISDIIQLRVCYLKDGRLDYQMGKNRPKKIH